MKSTLLKSLLITASVLLLTACGESNDEDKNPEQPQESGPYWSINDVTLRCTNEALCPDNQGILIVVYRSSEDHGWYTTKRLGVSRCTGTIYDTHRIITAGHCLDNLYGATEIYFKTVDK